jgi:hypothetical protein
MLLAWRYHHRRRAFFVRYSPKLTQWFASVRGYDPAVYLLLDLKMLLAPVPQCRGSFCERRQGNFRMKKAPAL